MARIRKRSSNAIPRAAAKISETKRRIRARNRGRKLSTHLKRNNGRKRAVCAALYRSTDIPREAVCALMDAHFAFSREFLRDCALVHGEKRNQSFFTGCLSAHHVDHSLFLFLPSLPCCSNPLLLGNGRDSALYKGKKQCRYHAWMMYIPVILPLIAYNLCESKSLTPAVLASVAFTVLRSSSVKSSSTSFRHRSLTRSWQSTAFRSFCFIPFTHTLSSFP